MQSSTRIKGTSAPSLSPQSHHLAVLTQSHLEIYSSPDLHLIRQYPVSVSQTANIVWAPTSSRSSARILLQTEDTVHVYDVRDIHWKATVTNGSGGMGKIVAARFSQRGDDVLVFSDFGSRLTVWALDDVPGGSINEGLVPVALSRHTEIKDPKPLSNNNTDSSCSFRPITSNTNLSPLFALLTRQGAQDVLSIHAPGTYAVLNSTILPTVDAQGFKWSRDGRWIAAWDSASAGAKVWVYTADGNLFRIWKTTSDDDDGEELGVKSLEWCPRSRYLAIGTYDGKVTVLGTRTFSPTIILAHTIPIQLSESGSIFQEFYSASTSSSLSTITYQPLPQPASPPTAHVPSKAPPLPRTGISIIAFDCSGRWVATREDSTPTTVWIWDLDKLTAASVAIQRAPVKSLAWHPGRKGVLLIGCLQEERIVYVWECEGGPPEGWVLQPGEKSSGKGELRWLGGQNPDVDLTILATDGSTAQTFWPKGRTKAGDDAADVDDSTDSVYEALMGGTVDVDDTFAGRGRFG